MYVKNDLNSIYLKSAGNAKHAKTLNQYKKRTNAKVSVLKCPTFFVNFNVFLLHLMIM